MNPLHRIDRARYWALTTPAVVFYGTLACNLRDVIDPSVETAATDGKVIKWNPAFLDKLTDPQVRFVLLHETLHCAHAHFWRLPVTTEGNIAGDYVINRILRDLPGIEAPAGVLDDRKYDGLAEEEVLKRLREQCKQPQPDGKQPQPQQPGPQDGAGAGNGGDSSQPGKPGDTQTTPQPAEAGKPQDAGGCGGFEQPAPDAQPAPGPGQPAKVAQPGTLRDHWDRAVVQAAQIAQSTQQGDLPADARRQLDRIRAAARPDWRAETAAFVRDQMSERPDWSRQARRHALAPVLHPSRRRDDVGTVVFVRDTSGSVTSELVSRFNDHVRNIVADLGCNAVVLDADAAVQAEYRVGPGDDVPDRAEGGGGTDFRPAFARVADLTADGERIAGVVYLTDMYGRFPAPEDIDVPTLWVATTDLVGPFGSTVRIDEA